MSANTPTEAQAVDAELASQAGAPWAREGGPPPPDTPEAQQRAAKWQRDVNRAERRRERRSRKQALREAAEKKAAERLVNNARRMYYAGFFLLPFVWLVALVYYRNENRDPDANPDIKRYYRNSFFFFLLYTFAFFAWFVVFEVFADARLTSLNILYYNGTSPNGF